MATTSFARATTPNGVSCGPRPRILARERAQAEADAYREREDRWQAVVDEFVREERVSARAPSTVWHLTRTALAITVVAPKERIKDLRAELRVRAQRQGLSFKEAGVYEHGRRGKIRLLLEGELKDVRRFLVQLEERFKARAGAVVSPPQALDLGPAPLGAAREVLRVHVIEELAEALDLGLFLLLVYLVLGHRLAARRAP